MYDKEKGEGVKLSGTFTVEVSTETIKTILEDSREQLKLDFGDSLDNLIQSMSASANIEVKENSRAAPARPVTATCDEFDRGMSLTVITPKTFDEALALAPKTDKRPPLGQWVHIGAFASLFNVSPSSVRRWIRNPRAFGPYFGSVDLGCPYKWEQGTTWFRLGHVARWWYEYIETGILPIGRKKSCRN